MLRKLASMARNQWAGFLALFLVLTGGTAMAVDGSLPGQNTVGSADIINGEVTQNDLAGSSVGSVKIADQSVKNNDLGLGASSSNTIADGGIEGVDVKDNTLKGADVDESSLAGLPPGNATTLDSRDSTDFAPAAAEGWHEVGTAGEPSLNFDPFGCQWENFGGPFNTPAFYKDPWGVVHVKGLVVADDWIDTIRPCGTQQDDYTIFELPAGYRPAALELQATISADEVGRVDITPSGEVRANGNNANSVFERALGYLSLDGITFKAAG